MNGDRIEVRYSTPRTGYITEVFTDTGVADAINMIKARAGQDTNISIVRHHPAPFPPPSSIFRPGENGR